MIDFSELNEYCLTDAKIAALFGRWLPTHSHCQQSVANLLDRAPSIELLFGSLINHVDDEGLIVQLGNHLDFEWGLG